MSNWKQDFTKRLLDMKDNSKENHLVILTQEDYYNLLQEIEIAKHAQKKTSLQYRRLKRFDVIEVEGVKKIIKKTNNEDIRYYLPVDEIYEVIDSVHEAIGHGGRDRLKMETAKNHANITIEMINLFLSMCEACQLKRKKAKKGLASKPILHTQIYSHCQLDLIDMQTQADGNYKYIMVYQDHLTKFVMLKPLNTKTVKEIAHKIVDIFTIFGAPCILHSDNEGEFVNNIIIELKMLWPELKLVRGKSKDQIQGSVKRSNQDIKNMLVTWMKDNVNTKWSEGLRFIQFMKNRSLHSGILQSPYKAMFGIEPKVGLSTTPLAACIIDTIKSEEDLENIVNMSEQENETEIVLQEDIGSEPEQPQQYVPLSYVTCELQENQEFIECNRHTGENTEFVCTRSTKEMQLKKIREPTSNNLIEQSEENKHISDNTHSKPSDNVTIPIPDVDKAEGGTVALSSGSSESYIHCTCRKRCANNMCKCKKNNFRCNSKCHGSHPCRNK